MEWSELWPFKGPSYWSTVFMRSDCCGTTPGIGSAEGSNLLQEHWFFVRHDKQRLSFHWFCSRSCLLLTAGWHCIVFRLHGLILRISAFHILSSREFIKHKLRNISDSSKCQWRTCHFQGLYTYFSIAFKVNFARYRFRIADGRGLFCKSISFTICS